MLKVINGNKKDPVEEVKVVEEAKQVFDTEEFTLYNDEELGYYVVYTRIIIGANELYDDDDYMEYIIDLIKSRWNDDTIPEPQPLENAPIPEVRDHFKGACYFDNALNPEEVALHFFTSFKPYKDEYTRSELIDMLSISSRLAVTDEEINYYFDPKHRFYNASVVDEDGNLYKVLRKKTECPIVDVCVSEGLYPYTGNLIDALLDHLREYLEAVVPKDSEDLSNISIKIQACYAEDLWKPALEKKVSKDE